MAYTHDTAAPAAPWLAKAQETSPAADTAPSEGDSQTPTAPEAETPPVPEAEEPTLEAVVAEGVQLAAAEVKLAGEVVDYVTVTVPKAFKLRLDHFREVNIPAGIQEIEREWAEHWYSKANGVVVYQPTVAAKITE